jgi:hypothetical protein
VTRNEKQWRQWFDKDAPEEEVIPDGYNTTLDVFRRLLLVRSWCPDRTLPQAKKYIADSLGERFADGVILDLERMWKESDPRSPMVCLLSMGSDPTNNIEALGKKYRLGKGMGNIITVYLELRSTIRPSACQLNNLTTQPSPNPIIVFLFRKLFSLEIRMVSNLFVFSSSLEVRFVFFFFRSPFCFFLLQKSVLFFSSSEVRFVFFFFRSPFCFFLLQKSVLFFSSEIRVVSMGQGQEVHARRHLQQGMTQGGWLLLQNCHLSLDYVQEVMDNIIEAETIDDTFRLWVTTEVHPKFPISFLQVGNNT